MKHEIDVDAFPPVAGSDAEYVPPELAPFPERMWHALRSLERRVAELEITLHQHLNHTEGREPEA